ncbi:TPA: hypothetical protein QCH64_002742 [Enterobacter asburiae]|uniref:DnaT-like ssDNA-binding domain-containing protein n=1 Tax=Enterobacter asburiae TaxID=61645 RepID=UPI001A29F3E2|nr:DnaT-like ssDNA-binding domain-containing protein [Enterobacter asburiae]MCS0625311.1 DnaT-like ssDNA-binding domain-containing protein [Enterobacter asburiae]HAT7488649.1 hypothetical protein [Enterobacter asburiae]HAT7510209.1 hypothetical protein [Enterobacter asburiae]HDR2364445.1 hypothetical protein [Enterobacter asburiae]
MAANWIKVEVITPDKPEIFRLAEILKIDPDAVLGKAIRFWVWADQQTIDGNANSVTKNAIDRVAFMSGFADALITVGWLHESNGYLTLPNFDRHNGESSKKRALTNRRVSEHRKQKPKSNAKSVTNGERKTLPEEEEEEDIKEREHNARDQLVDNSVPSEQNRFRMHPEWQPSPGLSERALEWGINLHITAPYTSAQLCQFCSYWMCEDVTKYHTQWEMTFAKSLEHQAIKKLNET